jgi:CDP-diacylglycerol--glycerol-3-phosphate 3-phosphatidyltransferase
MDEHERREPAPAAPRPGVASLETSILATMLGYFALQLAVFLGFSLTRGFFGRYGPGFLAASVGFHGFLVGVLFFFKNDFYIEPSGERLRRVNLANAITLFRVSSLPTILFLVFAAKDYGIRIPLLSLVVVVFLTDFADGMVSRKGKQITKIGRMLDSASDYCLLIVLSIAFYYYFLIPGWFLALVLGRLVLQAVLVFILIGVNRRMDPKTSPLGKVAVAAVMILYAAEILEIVVGPAAKTALLGLEALTGLILAASAVDKVLIFARELAESRKARRGRAV